MIYVIEWNAIYNIIDMIYVIEWNGIYDDMIYMMILFK
jgi:hypothetical protein